MEDNVIDFEALEQQLDPATRVIFHLFRQSHEQLLAINKQQAEQNKQQAEQISNLTEQIDELRRMLFGRKSEKMPSMDSQIRRTVEESEFFSDDENPDDVSEEEKKRRRRKIARAKSESKRSAKRKLKKNLPIIEETICVTPSQLPDGYTLADFREVAKGADSNVVHRIEHVREHLVRVKYSLQTLASKDGELIATALAPPSVVEGGHYGPGVYADVVVKKCIDSLPLYRIEKQYKRVDFPVSRSTLCSLFHRSANVLLPLYNLLLEMAKANSYVSADETRLPVQKPGKCKDEWIWTLVTDSVIAYYFSESRSSKVAKELLAGTTGHLQIDGYAAYNSVCEEGGRTRMGCLAHARRLFFKASKNIDDAKRMLEMIRDLYMVEHFAVDKGIAGSPDHLRLRQTESRAILDKMKTWLDENKSNFTPRSKMGKAITYARNQWEALIEFTNDPKLRLDNNYSENALRIIALGRKNYLFAGHEEGGQNLAILQTIVATCKLHNVNPYDYLKDVLIKIQQPETKDVKPLLPQNWGKPPPA